jgi:hypothetical protein
VPLPVTELGLNTAETNEGKPETLRLTVPVNPLIAEIVTVTDPLEFRFIEIDGGAEIVKSEAATITRVAVAVCTSGPLVPVMVSA